MENTNMKFCKFCGEKIPMDAVLCTHCGRQVEKIQQENAVPQIVVNNTSSNINTNTNNAATAVLARRVKNKWAAFFLCLFFGYLGVHKFYEGKILLGILYLLTFGLFGIGWFIDCIILLFKPNPYFV